MIEDAADNDRQFFMMVTPVAPHVQISKANGTVPPPPPAWKGKFADRKAPRNPDFNPDKPSGATWIYTLPKQNKNQIERGDIIHRGRLQNIAGIDDMVGDLIDKLRDKKLLDNTYIIVSSSMSEHVVWGLQALTIFPVHLRQWLPYRQSPYAGRQALRLRD